MLPKVVLYNAISVDGRVTGFDVDMGLFYGQVGRWRADVILTGVETLQAPPGLPEDDLSATPPAVRAERGDRRPIIAVTDSRGRLRCWDALRTTPFWRDAVALVSRSTPEEYISYLRKRGVRRIVAGDDRVDLRAALIALNRRYGAKLVRADCGGALNAALLRAALVDELAVLLSPVLAASASGIPLVRPPGAADGATRLRLRSVERLKGGSVLVRYGFVRPRSKQASSAGGRSR